MDSQHIGEKDAYTTILSNYSTRKEKEYLQFGNLKAILMVLIIE